MTVAQINVSKNGFSKGERLFVSSSFICAILSTYQMRGK